MSENERRSVHSLALELQQAMRRLLSPIMSDCDWCSDEDLENLQRKEDSVLQIVKTLRSLESPEAEKALMEYGPVSLVGILLNSTRPSDDKQRAQYALIGLQDESTILPLFEALSDPEASSWAFHVLSELRSPHAKALLPLAAVLAGLESHDIERCLEAVKHAGTIRDRRTVPSLIHALEYLVKHLDSETPPPHPKDAKLTLQFRIAIRRILNTLRNLGGEEAERAIERYAAVLESSTTSL